MNKLKTPTPIVSSALVRHPATIREMTLDAYKDLMTGVVPGSETAFRRAIMLAA